MKKTWILILVSALLLTACGNLQEFLPESSQLASRASRAVQEFSSAAQEFSSAAQEELSSATQQLSDDAKEALEEIAEQEKAEEVAAEQEKAEEAATEQEKAEEAATDQEKAEEAAAEEQLPVTILYTNDVHCQVEGDLGYRDVALIRKALETAGEQVLLVDCGDHLQGGIIGSISQGENIIQLMNAAGYDAAGLGNHECDYGIDRQRELASMATFPYVCCNLADMEGNLIYDPYKIFTFGSRKIAVIGILTPQTLENADPKHFKDEDGNFIYDIFADETGDRLVAQIQSCVDRARQEGADYVIALAHLGVSSGSSPYTSSELIPRLSGIDVMLDGHSHTVMEREEVKDLEGKKVLLTQTGCKLQNIGILRISEDGTITNRLVNNKEILETLTEVTAEVEEASKKVVARSEVDLLINDPEEKTADGSPILMVRRAETNLGDLCADAVRWEAGSQIGMINGGNVRDNIPAGDITTADLLKVHPFGNYITVVEMDGAAILDMLEYSVKETPGNAGGFLQVSGLRFDVDLTVDSTICVDGEEFTVEGERRVRNVFVGEEALEEDRVYTVAGSAFILTSGGDGYTFLPSRVKIIRDNFIIDADGLSDYLENGLGGKVGRKYEDPYGSGRIRMITSQQ